MQRLRGKEEEAVADLEKAIAIGSAWMDKEASTAHPLVVERVKKTMGQVHGQRAAIYA